MDNLKQSSREYMREYMKNNIHKYTKKTECFCGGKYDTIHKARHLKSKRHCASVNEKITLDSSES
jgi:hypothetical protein